MLFALSYLSFLRGDIIIEQYEMCKWRYLNSISFEHGKRVRHGRQVEKEMGLDPSFSAEKQLKETEGEIPSSAVHAKDMEKLKEFLTEYSNPFLLKYIKMYWKDYDSVESSVELQRSFDKLTERELNQLGLKEQVM